MPRINKGFLYIEDNTEQLRGQTEPLRIPNTHNHCVTLMENNCEGPMLIRISPYMEYHTEPLCSLVELV